MAMLVNDLSQDFPNYWHLSVCSVSQSKRLRTPFLYFCDGNCVAVAMGLFISRLNRKNAHIIYAKNIHAGEYWICGERHK